MCGNSACTDLSGGRSATAVPTVLWSYEKAEPEIQVHDLSKLKGELRMMGGSMPLRHHSDLMPAARITLAHFSVNSAKKRENSAGVLGNAE